ncbi:hypothetical protein BT67DRAFT_56351 [Trichocladium antarcticum]|uniref:Uncharacterized protein n=1 Tax=Trichocladium antarcticum TaxID=1450529 RepID=A0AAN6ZCU3_9PEZI|nr:hypothetical protein BT67DRAFT_56351 [Trichocladium antarcticum]
MHVRRTTRAPKRGSSARPIQASVACSGRCEYKRGRFLKATVLPDVLFPSYTSTIACVADPYTAHQHATGRSEARHRDGATPHIHAHHRESDDSYGQTTNMAHERTIPFPPTPGRRRTLMQQHDRRMPTQSVGVLRATLDSLPPQHTTHSTQHNTPDQSLPSSIHAAVAKTRPGCARQGHPPGSHRLRAPTTQHNTTHRHWHRHRHRAPQGNRAWPAAGCKCLERQDRPPALSPRVTLAGRSRTQTQTRTAGAGEFEAGEFECERRCGGQSIPGTQSRSVCGRRFGALWPVLATEDVFLASESEGRGVWPPRRGKRRAGSGVQSSAQTQGMGDSGVWGCEDRANEMG